MNSKIANFVLLLLVTLYPYLAHAGEQDNWYIADEWTVPGGAVGVFYDRNETSGAERLYVGTSQGVQLFEMNGTLIQTLFPAESSSWTSIPRSIAVDANGTGYYSTYDNGYKCIPLP